MSFRRHVEPRPYSHIGDWTVVATCTWLTLTAATLCGCRAGNPASPDAGPTAPVRGASIQEIMAGRVDPSADALWASVSTVITAAGTEERQPHTDAEWQILRSHAVTLIEGANFLAAPARRVTRPGGKTEDAAVPGIERPEDIQRAIDADPAKFRRAALRLRDAGQAALAAVDGHDPEALLEAGGELDEACEACHLQYWYPHSPRPK